MLINSNILADVICSTFNSLKLREQDRYHPDPGAREYGSMFTMNFRMHIDYEREDGYRHVDMFIYAPCSYVFVGARGRSTIARRDQRGGSIMEDYVDTVNPIQRLSYHDVCWRTDGVQSLLNVIGKKISYITGFRNDWYTVEPVTDEVLAALELKGGLQNWDMIYPGLKA